MTHDVGMADFESLVETQPRVVLYFWADWCGPCKVFAPLYAEAARRHGDIYFGKVNTEVAKDLAAAFHVRSIPTVMAFVREELVFEQAGMLLPAQLESLVAQLKDM